MLIFKVFEATYQLGKLVDIGVSGVIMASAGYSALFAGAVITWRVVLGFMASYHIVARKIPKARVMQ